MTILPGFVERYHKKKNTYEPILVLQYLHKLIGTFHKKPLNKAIAILSPIDEVLLIARLIVRHEAPAT